MMKKSLLYLMVTVVLFGCRRADDNNDKGGNGSMVGEPITCISMDIQSSPQARVGVDIDPNRGNPETYYWIVGDALILCELNGSGTEFTGNSYEYTIKEVPTKGEKANFIGANAITTGKYIVLHTRRWSNVTLPVAAGSIGFKIPGIEQRAEIASTTLPDLSVIQNYADNLFFSTDMVTGEQLLAGNAELKHQLVQIEIEVSGQAADADQRIRRVELQPETTNGYASSMTIDVNGNVTTIGGGIPTTYVTDPTAKLGQPYKVRFLARPTSLTADNGAKVVVHCGIKYSRPSDPAPTKTFVPGKIYLASKTVGNVDQSEPRYDKIRDYVGAFWRNDQVGERLIEISDRTFATGDWTATVAWTDGNWTEDEITILQEPKPEPYYNRFDDAASDTPPILAQSAMAAGSTTDNSIYFKIGLKNKYTTTDAAPARYAVILVTGNNNTLNHFIYLRQGETPSTIGVSSTTKWAVYNLGNYATPAPYNNGGFVRFPSQAGYFKKGSNNTTMYPPTPTGFVLDDWNADNTSGTMASVCPTGYKIPTCPSASSSSGDMYSLFDGTSTASNGKYIVGTYADGYSDRVYNSYLSGSYKPNPDYKDYQGHLVVNTTTYASLFFPMAGYRNPAKDGTVTSSSTYGGYWSSSTAGVNYFYGLRFITGTNASASRVSSLGTWGYNIRCVKD